MTVPVEHMPRLLQVYKMLSSSIPYAVRCKRMLVSKHAAALALRTHDKSDYNLYVGVSGFEFECAVLLFVCSVSR